MDTTHTPHFVKPVSSTIKRFPNDEMCEMRSVDETFVVTDTDVDTIVAICNEELVYNVLFKPRLNGKPYGRENAEGFLSWAREGWLHNEWFVFLIRNPRQRIIAAIDIKSNDVEMAEVGYWASAAYPGIMTSAVQQLCQLAKEARYKRLFALTIPENTKSASVLLRANFLSDGEISRDNKQYFKFSITL